MSSLSCGNLCSKTKLSTLRSFRIADIAPFVALGRY